MTVRVASVKCENCAAPLEVKIAAGTVTCKYCGHSFMFESDTPSEPSPSAAPSKGLVVPFAVEEEAARKRLVSYAKASIWAPGALAAQAKAATLSRLLAPAWSISARAVSNWTAESGTKQSNNQIEWSPVSGEHRGDLESRAVLAALDAWAPAARISSKHVERATPMENQHLEDAEIVEATISSEDAKKKMVKEIELAERLACQKMIPGAQKRNLKLNTSFEEMTASEVLLPVWKATVQHGTKRLVFYIDGRTGRVFGNRPISPKRAAVPLAAVVLFLSFGCLMANPWLGVLLGVVVAGGSAVFAVVPALRSKGGKWGTIGGIAGIAIGAVMLVFFAAVWIAGMVQPEVADVAPTTAADKGASVRDDPTLVEPVVEAQIVVRVLVFAPGFALEKGNMEVWDEQDEGPKPDVVVLGSVAGQRITRVSAEDTEYVEFEVPPVTTGEFQVDLRVTDTDGIFSSPQISKVAGLCSGSSLPCLFHEGAAAVEIAAQSDETPEDFQARIVPLFLDGKMEELRQSCSPPSSKCSELMQAIARYESHSAQATEMAKTSADEWFEAQLTDVQTRCGAGEPSCVSLGQEVLSALAAVPRDLEEPVDVLDPVGKASRVLDAQSESIAQICKAEHEGCVDAATKFLEYTSSSAYSKGWGDALVPSAQARTVRDAARPHLVKTLGTLKSRGSWMAFEDGSLRVSSARSSSTYRNRKQGAYIYDEAVLTADGYFVFVDASLKNTTNTAQVWAKVDTVGSVRIVEPFGLSLEGDRNLESYIEHNKGGTRDGEALVFDVMSGETWPVWWGFDVPEVVPKEDLYLEISGSSQEGEMQSFLVKLF